MRQLDDWPASRFRQRFWQIAFWNCFHENSLFTHDMDHFDLVMQMLNLVDRDSENCSLSQLHLQAKQIRKHFLADQPPRIAMVANSPIFFFRHGELKDNAFALDQLHKFGNRR